MTNQERIGRAGVRHPGSELVDLLSAVPVLMAEVKKHRPGRQILYLELRRPPVEEIGQCVDGVHVNASSMIVSEAK